MATQETVPEIRSFVGGRPVDPKTSERLDVLDPATGEVLGRVPLSGPSEVDQAVQAAAEAFESWQDEPVTRRARRMFGLQALLERQLDELAGLVTRENGKHLDEARGEVRRGIEVVELAAGMTTLMKGETLDQVASGVDVSLHRFPLGVCCGITPFNFPAMIPMWFAPLAIAAGNTFVLKPSQRTPLTANRLAELFAEAGFPDGVLNVVHGAQGAVEALIDHPQTRAVSFVGSAPVARKVYERSGSRGKRVQALAGAKNHLVVMPDAELELAVPAVFASAFSNAGQRCLAGSVAVGVGGIGDELVAGISRMAREAQVAPGDEPGTDADSTITPVTTSEALERIADYIELGEREGATLCVDGRRRGEDERILPRADRVRRGLSRDDPRQGGDLRPRAGGGADRGPGRGDRRDQRLGVRKRGRDLHPGRRRRPQVRARGAGGDDRGERLGPGPCRLLPVRRLAGLVLRRPPRHRTRRGRVLHPEEGGYEPLAVALSYTSTKCT